MTGTLPFPRRSHRPDPGSMVTSEADLAALTAEEPRAMIDSACGLQLVRRERVGGCDLYTVGFVGALTAPQAAKLCLMIGAYLPDLPYCG